MTKLVVLFTIFQTNHEKTQRINNTKHQLGNVERKNETY